MAEARDVDQDDGERVRTWDWPGTPEQRDAYLAEVGHDDGGEMFRQSLEAVRRADVDVRMPDGTYKSAQELTEADWAAASTRPPGAIRRLPGAEHPRVARRPPEALQQRPGAFPGSGQAVYDGMTQPSRTTHRARASRVVRLS